MNISRRSPYSTGPDGVARPNPPDLPLAEYSTTRTIRSQCNLRRDSIQLVPVPGQPYEYDVSFLFDCGADTSVSIHFLACDRMQVFNTPAFQVWRQKNITGRMQHFMIAVLLYPFVILRNM